MLELLISRQEYDEHKQDINKSKWIDIIPVFNTYESHIPYLNKTIIGFFVAIPAKSYLILNGHMRSSYFKLDLPISKIRYLHKSKYLYSKGVEEFMDMETSHWIDTNKELPSIEEHPIYKKFKRFYSDIKYDLTKYIPETLLGSIFQRLYTTFLLSLNSSNDKYKEIYNQYIKDLSVLDSNGIHINKKKFLKRFELIEESGVVYPDYTFFNLTGRPNGANGRVNFSALKKDRESRGWLKSRHDNGLLIEVDFNSYHLYLIADIIDYRGFKNRNVYEYMAERLYGLTELSKDKYDEIKREVFQALYSDKNYEIKQLQFFQYLEKFKQQLYEEYLEEGFVYSYKETRKIKVEDASASKVFNYYLQCYETDNSMYVLNIINKLLKGKNTKVILYTYDSFLFDFDKDEGQEFLYKIFECFNLPVKISAGEDYYKMRDVLI